MRISMDADVAAASFAHEKNREEAAIAQSSANVRPGAVSPGNPHDSNRAFQVYELEHAVRTSLAQGNTEEAFCFIEQAHELDPATRFSEEWLKLGDYNAWSDGWLIAAIAKEPPNKGALNALASRYWKLLFGHCRLLTCDPHSAKDLAQTAWYRILRTRTSLRADGNFAAYISVVATNLWRDMHRAALRAGAMAVDRLVSIDATIKTGGSSTELSLAEVLPDLESLRSSEQEETLLEVYSALEGLSPLLRDVVVARFIAGESCAEIGRRNGRTEQTISGWIRQATKQMRATLQQSARALPPQDPT